MNTGKSTLYIDKDGELIDVYVHHRDGSITGNQVNGIYQDELKSKGDTYLCLFFAFICDSKYFDNEGVIPEIWTTVNESERIKKKDIRNIFWIYRT